VKRTKGFEKLLFEGGHTDEAMSTGETTAPGGACQTEYEVCPSHMHLKLAHGEERNLTMLFCYLLNRLSACFFERF